MLRGGLRPRVLELLDKASIDHMRPRSRYRSPTNAGAIVLIEVDGEPDAHGDDDGEIGGCCDGVGALEVLGARDDAERARLWQARRGCSRRRSRRPTVQGLTRTSASRAAGSSRCSRASTRIAARTGFLSAVFGHAGDGNLHVNLLSTRTRDAAVAARWAAPASCSRTRWSSAGRCPASTASASPRREYMALEQSPEVIDWQKRLKRLWDPPGLLNPGKIFAD